jgi:hypothetical protein
MTDVKVEASFEFSYSVRLSSIVFEVERFLAIFFFAKN